jgi:hypothetical protein
VTPEGVGALAEVGAAAIAVHEAPVTLEEAMRQGTAPVVERAERAALAWTGPG